MSNFASDHVLDFVKKTNPATHAESKTSMIAVHKMTKRFALNALAT